MKRILVIGCCGAGKSTFTRKLQALAGLPVIHLDQEYWLPGWAEPPKAEWQQKVRELASRDAWIMDGNYRGSIEIRLAHADAVIYLDMPGWRCLLRVLKRIIRYHGKERPDMPKGCPERLDWAFLHYVAMFNRTRRPQMMHRMAQLPPHIPVHILRSDRESLAFLKTFSQSLRE